MRGTGREPAPAPAPDASSSSSSSSSSGTDVDETAVLSALAGGAFRTSPSFTLATHAPFASAAAQGAWVEEWVSSDAYAAYAQVRPDAAGSHVTLAPGSMIVRVVTDANGNPTELTVMVKGPHGYNPALGDWWFGVAEPDGTPVVADGGADDGGGGAGGEGGGGGGGGVMMGRLSACYTCHAPRSEDDFLFGVPAGDRP